MKADESKKSLYWEIGLTALFVVAVLLFFPIWSSFQLDADEGVNLGKAMLLDKGFKLYSETWSDQPPVLTYILAGIIRLFGNTVVIARLAILAFSALIVWLTLRIMQRNASLGAAIIALLLLLYIDPFVRISYAVMIGLPAISLGLFSLFALLQWHKSAKYSWLLLSAVVLALSVMIKLFSGLLAPIFFIGLLVSDFKGREKGESLWQTYLPTLTWSIVFTLLLATIFFLVVGVENVQQLIGPHLDARDMKVFQNISFSAANSFLLLAGLGILFIVQDKKWLFYYPVAWMIVSYILLLNQRPVWYHQVLLFNVPAFLVAAYAANEGFVSLRKAIAGRLKAEWRTPRNYFGLAALVLFFVFLITAPSPRFVEDMQAFSFPPNIAEDFSETRLETLSAIERYAAETVWLLTDRPMYAYRTGILMPPELAVISSKRFLTGNLRESEIIETIKAYRPEQVLLGRFDYEHVFAFLAEDYTLLPYSEEKDLHFVLNEFVE